MAKTDITTWKAYVNANINTNGVNAITGAIMNKALIDICDSVIWGMAQQGFELAVTTSPLVVTFPVAFDSADYTLLIRAYDGAGNPIDYMISNVLATSFTITGAVSGLIDWRATL